MPEAGCGKKSRRASRKVVSAEDARKKEKTDDCQRSEQRARKPRHPRFEAKGTGIDYRYQTQQQRFHVDVQALAAVVPGVENGKLPGLRGVGGIDGIRRFIREQPGGRRSNVMESKEGG
jgi:hypothetical protein